MNIRLILSRLLASTALMPLMLLLTAVGQTKADTILADFAADLQPVTPKAGWSYLYNGSGVALGNSANYSLLQAVPQPNNLYYDRGGVSSLPAQDPTAFTFFGITGFTNVPGGHPGRGPNQAADGLEHFAIAGFTLPSSGDTHIANSSLSSVDNSTDGIDVRVFVNDTDTGISVLVPAHGTGIFNGDLGDLDAGDMVYVAIGSNGVDLFDTFVLGYQITQSVSAVPEPCSTATLLLLGVTAIFGPKFLLRKLT